MARQVLAKIASLSGVDFKISICRSSAMSRQKKCRKRNGPRVWALTHLGFLASSDLLWSPPKGLPHLFVARFSLPGRDLIVLSSPPGFGRTYEARNFGGTKAVPGPIESGGFTKR